MKKVSSIKLLLIITISILLKDTLSEQNSYGTYESLAINKNYYELQFSFEHHSANIPDSLTQLFQESSIQQLTLFMGIVNPSSLPKTNENNNKQQNLQIPPIYQGISLILKNSSQISVKNFKSIAQSLSVSRSQEFITYLNQSQLTFISNPNDKFCSQHLKIILDLFLPCRNNAGIGSIINQKTFFIDKMFIGVKLYWKIGQSVRLSIFMDKTTQQVKNYLKISQQKRQSRRCMHFDTLKVFDDSKIQTKKQQNLKQTKQTPTILFTKSIKASFGSNYYSMDKLMLLSIDLNSLLNQVENHSERSQRSQRSQKEKTLNEKQQLLILTGRLALPYGFQMQKVTYTCQNCKQILQNVSISIKKINDQITQNIDLSYSPSLLKNYQTLSILQIRLKNTPLQNLSQQLISNDKKPLLTFKFNYKSHLKPFEDYENIAGGGQEFMNVPFTLQTESGKDILIVSNSMRNMFDRLLEPDFSIPFKTITFTLAIIGYLWISVWKAFSSQILYQKQRKTKEQNQKTLQSKSGQQKDHIELKQSQNQLNKQKTSSTGLKQE